MFGLLFYLLLAGFTHVVVSISPLTVKGTKFFTGGQQFFLKGKNLQLNCIHSLHRSGVAYQGTPNDPLVDTTQCALDADMMSQIGTNSIRVYHVDPAQNHDGCMDVFAAKGIYIWLDLDTFSSAIVQGGPQWTSDQLNAFARVMDAFQHYDNLGGFWIGNEIVTGLDGSNGMSLRITCVTITKKVLAAPFIKAAMADMKAYRALKGYREVPIGYSAADIAELRPMLQNYLACGSPDTQIDFFGCVLRIVFQAVSH